MSSDDNGKWNVNDYKHALDLVKELQSVIEKQQHEIDYLKQQGTAFRNQNESLRKQRDDLRIRNAQLTSEIANLSRRNSLSASQNGFSERLSSTGAQATPPTNRPLPQQIEEEKEDIHLNSSEDTDYEDTEAESPVPTIPKKVSLPTNSRRSYLTSTSTLQTKLDTSTTTMNTGSSAESSLEVSSTDVPESKKPFGSERKHGLTKFNTLGFVGKSQSIDSQTGTIGFVLEDEVDGVEEPLPIRQRLATVAAKPSLGERSYRRVGGGSRQPGHALRRQNSFPRRGQRIIVRDLTYLSPDMEMKIQEMIQEAIGKKYGDLEKAIKAATSIQKAYREYKIRKRFEEIRQQQQVAMVRRRAFSVKYPHGRRPSMIGPRKYRRDTSAPSVDPLQRVQDAHKQITSRSKGISPHISRRDLIIHNTSASKVVKHHHPQSKSPSLIINEAQQCMPDTAECLSSSLPSDELSPAHIERSPSIFSGMSVQNMEEIFPLERAATPQMESATTLKRKTNIGVNIFNKKPTRGIQYLVFQGVLEDHPLAVSKFLYNQYGLSKDKIGEFVGEIRFDFNVAVLECLVELIDFSGKTIDEALRQFQQLFRMPGEAQKIDKIMQVFAGEYYRHNEGGVINSEDAAYVLAFATMMLHTDLHNPAVRRHMTKPDWLRMNKGTNDDEDYPKDFLLALYDRVSKIEFTTGVDHTKEVADVQRSIVGTGCPRLINPQRQLVHKIEVSEVMNIHRRPLVAKHRRMLFLFNDVFLVTKPVGGRNPAYEFKKAWSLLNAQVLEFGTEHSPYKYGVCIQRTLDGQKYQCNCDSKEDQKLLCKYLNDAIEELAEMERDRILELGSTLEHNVTFAEHNEGHKRGNRESAAGDLLSTITMSASVQDMRSVGTEVQDAWCVSTASMEVDIKRSSKDSGFDSPHATSPAPGIPYNAVHQTPPGKRRERPTTPDNKRGMLVLPTVDPRKVRSRSLTPTPHEQHIPSPSLSDSKTLPSDVSKGKKGRKTRFTVSSSSSESLPSLKKGKASRTKSSA